MNFFKRRLTSDEIEQISEHLKQSSDFTYSIMEGGYISNDYHVIFCTDRTPYLGMLMPLRSEAENEQEKWTAYFKSKFNLNNI